MGSGETSKRKADPYPASVSQPATKRVRSSYDDILTVIVGEDKLTKTFKVHKDLVATRSTYFKSATALDRWLEGKENTVRLTEHHPRTFETYIECLYNPQADLFSIVADFAKTHVEGFSTNPNFEKYEKYWTKDATLRILAEHWVLGDYLGNTAFKDRVIEKLHANSQLVLVWDKTTQYIVQNTASTSGLYRWLVEQYHGMILSAPNSETKDSFIEQMPPALLKDVLKLFALRSKESDKVAKLDGKTFFDGEGSG